MRTSFSSAAAVRFVTLALVGLWCAGCGRVAEGPTQPRVQRDAGGATPLASSNIIEPYVPYDASNFHRSTRIDNRFLPLVPGTQFVLEGVANRGGGLLPHRVVFTVTDVVKSIDGVPNVVVWDNDFNEGVLAESELAFFAQDDDGNVWSTGEYPEEYDANGVFTGAPATWIHGIQGARAGTMMIANPASGTGYYLQGYSPDIAFYDVGKVFQAGTSTTVPAGSFTNVLITDEKSPLEPGHQRKYYAPGVGNVQIGAVGDPEGETLVLTSYRRLSLREARDARRAVFKLEARAYQVSDVYRQTPPAQ